MGGIGVIANAGVIVNNNIVLIATYDDLRHNGMTKIEAILETCRERARPVVLTALTAIFGVLPIAFGLNLARLETTGRPVGQPVLGRHQPCFELGQQGFGVLCRVPLAGRKIQVTRESGAVVADGHQQAALHHHAGVKLL